MTDRLDAIEKALDEGFWDEAGGTDVRWLVGEVRRLRRAESEREDWRTTANNLAALVGKQEADLTALRQRHAADLEAVFSLCVSLAPKATYDPENVAGTLMGVLGAVELERQRHDEAVKSAYMCGLHEAFTSPSADPEQCWQLSAARRGLAEKGTP